MAKKFFYVCAGLFLLMAAYAVGARSAVAQSGSIQGASLEFTGNGPGHYRASAVRNGQFYWLTEGTTVGRPVGSSFAEPVIATDPKALGVLLENGDVLQISGEAGDWTFRGNLFGGATPAQRSTWGQVKSRYAPNPQTPTSETNDR
jgi:hypothetical protein